GVWNVVMQPIGFLVFMVASFAESARLPFDLPEAEQELIGGYHTEYSGLRLLLYLIAEFLHMVTAAFLISILFLGGWHLWGITGSGDAPITWLTALLRVAVLLTKVFGMIIFFMLVRWSWPRFRFDQLMSLAWKVMLPLGMVNLAIMAVVVEYQSQIMRALGGSQAALVAAMWAIAIFAWVVAGLVSPLSTDNRPRVELSDRL
ncbi:MAG TPA: complex I subunit 1 family protein, partial [Pirellulales bacterium]